MDTLFAPIYDDNYFTVELIDEHELRESFAAAQEQGLPVVAGEFAHKDGYHYYPSIEQVRGWVGAAEFELLEEATGDGYHHMLTRAG